METFCDEKKEVFQRINYGQVVTDRIHGVLPSIGRGFIFVFVARHRQPLRLRSKTSIII